MPRPEGEAQLVGVPPDSLPVRGLEGHELPPPERGHVVCAFCEPKEKHL